MILDTLTCKLSWTSAWTERHCINIPVNEAVLTSMFGRRAVQMVSAALWEAVLLSPSVGDSWQIFIVIGLGGNKQCSSPHWPPAEPSFPLSPACSDSLNLQWDWSEWWKRGRSVHFGGEGLRFPLTPLLKCTLIDGEVLMVWEMFDK